MKLLLALACSDYRLEEEEKPGAPEAQVRVEATPTMVCPGAEVDVRVANTGDATLWVESLRVEGTGWEVTATVPFSVAPDAEVVLPVTGDGGAVTLVIGTNDADEPEILVPIAAAADQAPEVRILSPYDEETLPVEGDVVLSALVGDPDHAVEDLTLEWVSTASGSLGPAVADADGRVETIWPAAERLPGPQWLYLLVTDPCGVGEEGIAWVCQDGPWVIEPIVEEAWHLEGPSVRGETRLTVSDGTRAGAASVFDLASVFDGDRVDVAWSFRIQGVGGEGLALVLLDADRRVGYLGGDGCGVGFGGNLDCTAGPALPGWALVLDTVDDPGDCAPGPHLAFHVDGDLAVAPAACVAVPDPQDGAWHTGQLHLADGHLEVSLDGTRVLDAPLAATPNFPGVVGFSAAARTEGVVVEVESLLVTDFTCAM